MCHATQGHLRKHKGSSKPIRSKGKAKSGALLVVSMGKERNSRGKWAEDGINGIIAVYSPSGVQGLSLVVWYLALG